MCMFGILVHDPEQLMGTKDHFEREVVQTDVTSVMKAGKFTHL